MFYLIGLGNPGEEYANTRHNVGRETAEAFCKKNDFSDFSFDKKSNSLIAKGKIGKESVLAILPETQMNNSGKAVSYFVKSKKEIKNILVLHDDLDMSIENQKIIFDRGSGGHRGVESINKNLKTTAYPRMKIGISGMTTSGKTKKPKSEKIINHVLGKFSDKEKEFLKKSKKKIFEGIESTIKDGYLIAMNNFN